MSQLFWDTWTFLNKSFDTFFGFFLNCKTKLTSITLLAVLFSSFFSCLLLLLFSAAFVCSCSANNGGWLMEMTETKTKTNKKQCEEHTEGVWLCYGQTPEWMTHNFPTRTRYWWIRTFDNGLDLARNLWAISQLMGQLLYRTHFLKCILGRDVPGNKSTVV